MRNRRIANMQRGKKIMAASAQVKFKKPIERAAGPVRRVSLEIPVDLWEKAKIAAFRAREPLRDLLLAGLRAELERRGKSK